MTWYASFHLFIRESARSIGHRSNTLSTHMSIDQIDHSYYNTILKEFYYILIILVDHWISSDSIESMEECCVGLKIVYNISIEKHVWV